MSSELKANAYITSDQMQNIEINIRGKVEAQEIEVILVILYLNKNEIRTSTTFFNFLFFRMQIYKAALSWFGFHN